MLLLFLLVLLCVNVELHGVLHFLDFNLGKTFRSHEVLAGWRQRNVFGALPCERVHRGWLGLHRIFALLYYLLALLHSLLSI